VRLTRDGLNVSKALKTSAPVVEEIPHHDDLFLDPEDLAEQESAKTPDGDLAGDQDAPLVGLGGDAENAPEAAPDTDLGVSGDSEGDPETDSDGSDEKEKSETAAEETPRKPKKKAAKKAAPTKETKEK